jgi:2-methylisocitrate lyase-like PEP mutase family enzyme
MTSLDRKAEQFRALHRKGDPVVLPTVWDAWSAELAANAGFAGLTVGSHPVADSVGRSDGEGMAFTELLGRVREITRVVDIPVSVDIESGYGLEPTQLIEGLLDAGAVGFNIEDVVHREGDRLRGAQEHAELIHALRKVAVAAEVPIVINARTDYLFRKLGPADDRLQVTIERMRLCADAGADVLYPLVVGDDDALRALAEALPLPINAVVAPERADRAHLAELGVGRISFGPMLQRALGVEADRLLARWR